MESLITTFVPVAFLEVIRDRLDKFVRQMTKRGLPAPTLSLGKVEQRSACNRPHAHEQGCPVADWQEVTLMGESPKFNGWRLVASVDAVNGKPLFRTVPGESVPSDLYSNDPMWCDHCKTNRFRSEVFIIGHDDGRMMQVGRQCIRDFLGWDVGPIVRFWESVNSMMDEPEGGFGSYVRPEWKTADVLKVACDVVSVEGFYRKSIEDDSTKSIVFDIIAPRRSMTEADRREYSDLLTKYASQPDQSARIFDATMAAIPTLDVNKSEWAYNLQTLMGADLIDAKHVGILSSAVILGLRALEQKVWQEVEKKRASEYIGKVGDKINVDTNLFDQRIIDGYYGTTVLYTFGVGGDVVKWFSSRDLDLINGEAYRVAGTVKKHEEYNGRKSTVITRAKVEPLPRA